MRPFNLKEYLENPTMKIVTRDGRNVRIICTDAKDNIHPIIALIEYGDVEKTIQYSKDGKYYLYSESDFDLYFAPEKKEGWINIYRRNNGSASVNDPSIYQSKETAKYNGIAFTNYVTTVKIDWEE